MKRLALASSLVACASLLGVAIAAEPTPLVSGIDASAADPSVRAQDDFFRHVNGTWLKNVVIPGDRARIGSFDSINDNVQDELKVLVEATATQKDSSPETAQIDALYRSFMDEATIEKLGITPLADELAAIDKVQTVAELAAAMGHLTRIEVATPIRVVIDQDDKDATRYVPNFGQSGLGLPDRDYYLLTDDAKFAEARKQYAVYIAKVLDLSNAVWDGPTMAQSVIALETALAKGQWTRVENRDPVKTYNKVEVKALPGLAPGMEWSAWLTSTELAGKSTDVIVAQPSYMALLAAEMAATPLPVWKAYLRVRLIDAYAPYLSKAFVDAKFAFSGTALSGVTENRPRWKRGVTLVQASVGESLGKLYVDTYFPASSKARMEKLVANLLAAYKTSIDSIDWMTPATKKEAQAKLATFSPKIGYPKRFIDYRSVVIKPDDLAGNVTRARRFDYTRNVAKLGKPVDRDEWHMTPQTVNAYYNASMNEIVFPAAILRPPFFDPRSDDAANYGAIGAIIGHEISHGFDDKGSLYDEKGNLRTWWTAEDRARFDAKTKLLVAAYSSYSPVKGYTLNGELTLGENIADGSGLEIAYKAYHASLGGKPAPVIDGRSGDERFFEGYAQAHRAKARDSDSIARVKSDPHSPGEFRVNGVVRNHPAFYTTFDVKPTDGMYLPPEKRVSIW